MDASADATLDGTPGDRFRGQMLLLRGRAGLTQRALAALLGVSEKAVQKWEAGEGYPSAARLQALIALYMARHVFTAGGEAVEARALWELLRREATQRTPPFDEAWFATVHPAGAAPPALVAEAAAQPEPPAGPRQDWGEAPEVRVLQGRRAELETLERWLREERCREVALLGLGGIGKTALAARLAQDLAPHFAGLCWRSLHNAPPPEEWLGAAIAALAPVPPVLPPGLPARLGVLLTVLRERRCLLVLDNLETVLEPGERAARYRAGYEGYGTVLRQLGESAHQSTILVTGREASSELALLAGAAAPVRLLRLAGLDLEAGRTLLQDKGLAGDEDSWQALVGRYGGNPLALKVVGQTIAELFGGQIAAFLRYATETHGAVFGGVRQLLEEQVARLSPVEQSLLYWLAVAREPVGVAVLAADLGPAAGPGSAVLDAMAGLERRSLLEAGGWAGTFTLQPVVLEYATDRLVQAVAEEITHGRPALLVSHALLKAQARDYVRRSQERLIAQPLLDRPVVTHGGEEHAERRLLGLLDTWRGRPPGEQGYGPGNVVNLLRLLRGNVRGLDLSRLSIRQAYLQETEAQDASLAGSHLAQAVLEEAFDYIQSVALSADAAYLAAGTSGGEVCLWRVADRTLLWSVRGHTGMARAIAMSADGRLVASGSHDGTVKVWAAESGACLATLQGHSGGVVCVAVNADGHLVASSSVDGTARLWAAPSGECLAILQGHVGPVYGVALSADGQLAASGGEDGTVRLWATESGECLVVLHEHTGGVWDVALSADGHLIASGGGEGMVKLWATTPTKGCTLPDSGRLLATLQGHTGGVQDVAFSANGQLLASGGQDGTVHLWAAPSGERLALLQAHAGVVWGVAPSADGRLIASGGGDATIRLWAAPSGECLALLQGQSGAVRGVALSAEGRLLASGGVDKIMRLWDVGSGRSSAAASGHSGGIYSVALSADGQLAASGGEDGTVRLWAAERGECLATLQGHASVVSCVALSADGRLVASGGPDKVLRLWAAPRGERLAALHGHIGGIWSVALSADGRLVASGGEDGTVRLWATASGECLAIIQGHIGVVWAMALSAEGQLVASGGVDGVVRLWATASGECLAALPAHTGGVWDVALSADGRLLASAGGDGTVKLWATASGECLATLQAHAGVAYGVALSADGRVLASGGGDGAVKLWNATSGALLRTLRPDRPYERLDITGLTGVTEAQRAALFALGAIEQGPA